MNSINLIKQLFLKKLEQGIYIQIDFPLFKNKENKHGKSKHRSIK